MAGDDTVEGVKADIERARESLAASVDQIAYRTNPGRLADRGKAAAVEFVRSPRGKAVIGGAGALLAVLVVLRFTRHSNPA